MADGVRYSLGVIGYIVVDKVTCVVGCSINLVDGLSVANSMRYSLDVDGLIVVDGRVS